MDKYIKQLLELYSKIILPQFGAIVVENEETGELMFNEYLSYDDGKLSELIEKESNMDLQEAQNMVAKFVRDLQLQLDKGETYSIFQLGEFSKNKDGEFTFEGNLKTGHVTSASAEAEKPADVFTPPVVEVKKEEPIKKEEKPEIKKEISNKGEKKNIYVENKETFPKSDSDTVKKDESKKEAKKEKPVKVKKEKVIVPPKVKTPKPPKKPGEVKEKRKRSPLLWIILVILLLVAAGSVYIGLNYEKVEEFMGWNKFENVDESDKKAENEIVSVEEEVLPEENETPVEDEITTEEAIEEVEEKPKKETIATPIAQSSSGNHHIIVGCFSEISNAQGLVSEFKQQGYDAKVIGQYGGLHFVSAQSYPTSSEAVENISKVRQIKDGAWIFKN